MLTNILKEFDKDYPPVECSAHERTSSAMCICEELPEINQELTDHRSFLKSALERCLDEVKLELGNKTIKANSLKEGEAYWNGYYQANQDLSAKISELKK